jgi:DNA-directed RNA polymerase
MDASHLILILNKISQPSNTISPVISIHDCFGTLPNNMIDLESLVKKEFINLYSKQDFLEKFNSDLLAILEKYKIYHEVDIKENKVKIIIEKSANSNLPFITSQLKRMKFEEISF